MLRIIFIILLTVYFFAELSAFSALANHIGVLGCLLQIVLTIVLGAKVIANQPREMIKSLQGRVVAGESPQSLLVGGVRVLFAGVFLVLPGPLSDLVGLWLWLSGALSKKVSSSHGEWGQTSSESQKGFDDAWHGDEFEEKMKNRVKEKAGSDIADATIISTEENPKS